MIESYEYIPQFTSRAEPILTVEGEAGADFMRSTLRGDVVEPLGIKSKTEGSTNTRAERLGVAYKT